MQSVWPLTLWEQNNSREEASIAKACVYAYRCTGSTVAAASHGLRSWKAQFRTTKLLKKQRAKECEAWAKAQIQELQRKLKGKEAQLQRELRKAKQEVEKLSKRRGIFQDINSMGKLTRQQYKKELVRRLGLGCRYKDTDVFHIIASKNGGADHPHNYSIHAGEQL